MCECEAAYTVVSSNLVSDLHRNDLKTHYDKVNHLLTEEKVKEKQLNISFPFHHCQKKNASDNHISNNHRLHANDSIASMGRYF